MKATLSIRQRHHGGHGAALTLADQLLSSASNFVLGVLIARAGGAEALGAFGIAFLVWLAVVGANRALVTEPMMVTGSTEESEAELGEGLRASLVMGAGVAATLAVIAGGLYVFGVSTVALLALAPWIPSLLAHDYFRGMAFRLQRPIRALVSDAVLAATQGAVIVGWYALDRRTVATFLAAWGIGASVGALVGGLMSHTRLFAPVGGVAHLGKLWSQSRWFFAEFGTAFVATQGYLVLLPMLLGIAAFGTYRAGASLIGPVVVFFIAGNNVGLPESVRRLRDGGTRALATYTPRFTAAVASITAIYCGTVAVLAAPILRLTYGVSFTEAAVITQLLAITYMIAAIGLGCGVALKAAEHLRFLWFMRAAHASVSVTGLVILVHLFGLVGAAWATIASGATYTAGVAIGYHRMRRRSVQDSGDIRARRTDAAALCVDDQQGTSSVEKRGGAL